MRLGSWITVVGLGHHALATVAARLETGGRRRRRPWALPLRTRIVVVCTSLRTNLTLRELAVLFGISTSQAHCILVDLIPRLAALLRVPPVNDRRRSWLVDGTLIPTRDHDVARRSKNYRYSCNVHVLARHHDRRVIAIAGGGPGNRNDPMHHRGSSLEALCRGHGNVLADGGYRGIAELRTPRFHRNRIVRDRRWRWHRRRRARIEQVLARLKDWRALRDYRRRAGTLVQMSKRSPSSTISNYGTALRERDQSCRRIANLIHGDLANASRISPRDAATRAPSPRSLARL